MYRTRMQREKAQAQEAGGLAAEDKKTNPSFQHVNEPVMALFY